MRLFAVYAESATLHNLFRGRSVMLTPTQKRLLTYITAEMRKTGRPPTLQEMCHRFGWNSDNSARQNLKLLEKKGAIILDRHSARGIRLPGTLTQLRQVPLVGKVAAGVPIEALENVEETLGLDPGMFPDSDLFALRITGESMSGIGIRDHDTAIIRRQQTADAGDIVVAIINNEATVKRYMPQSRRIILKAENPSYEDIAVTKKDTFELVGVVVGIVRRM